MKYYNLNRYQIGQVKRKATGNNERKIISTNSKYCLIKKEHPSRKTLPKYLLSSSSDIIIQLAALKYLGLRLFAFLINDNVLL